MVRAPEAINLLIVDVEIYIWVLFEAFKVVKLVARAHNTFLNFVLIDIPRSSRGLSIAAIGLLFFRHFFVLLARVVGFQLSTSTAFALEELLFLNATWLLANIADCKLL